MANKVTFDYSKAAGFVQEHEMAYMSELVACLLYTSDAADE